MSRRVAAVGEGAVWGGKEQYYQSPHQHQQQLSL